jgi:hypothetical protein
MASNGIQEFNVEDFLRTFKLIYYLADYVLTRNPELIGKEDIAMIKVVSMVWDARLRLINDNKKDVISDEPNYQNDKFADALSELRKFFDKIKS